MSLRARIDKLERDRRGRHLGEPCRWHQGLVIYPAGLARDEDGQIILPACEAPATCPGPTPGTIYLPERRTG